MPRTWNTSTKSASKKSSTDKSTSFRLKSSSHKWGGQAAPYQKIIDSITAPDAQSQTPLDDLKSIDKAVTAIKQVDLITALNNASQAISSAETARKSACDALPKDSTGLPEVSNAQTRCTAAERHATEESTAIGDAQKNLQAALKGIPPYVVVQVQALTTKLDTKLKPEATAPDLINKLPLAMPVLRQAPEDRDAYQDTWKHIASILAKLKFTSSSDGSTTDDGDASKSVQDALDVLKTAEDGSLKNFNGWFKTLGDYAKTSARSLDVTISDVETDPAKNSAAALGAVRDQSDGISGLQSVVDTWPFLASHLVDRQPPDFDLKATKLQFEDLQKAVNSLRGAVSRLHDALAGDFKNFETDQVSLYYFTDVPRLMYVLNENIRTVGGIPEAQANAAAQRKALSQTEFELADAQATVNRYQKEVLDLQEQQRQAQAKLKNLDAKVSRLGSRLNHAQEAKTNADGDYESAKNEANNDPSKAAALEKAKVKQDNAATKLSQSQSDYDSAKTERENAQKQMDDSQNQSDGLPAKLAAARQALSDAQTAVSQDRRKMLLAAQEESDAFALARDNEPFLYATADASSPNPARRVMLYAFKDSKIIFMRGKPDDLAEVKHIIAEFDRPAPQARLTLWTFELSAEAGGKANPKSAERLNKAMEIVDQELGDTRALENTTTTLLRDIINEQVTAWAQSVQLMCPDPIIQNSVKREGCTRADKARLQRINFYNPAVLKQLNFNPDFQESQDQAVTLRELRELVPDPAGTTTLGEALMVLSLARPEIRTQVRNHFEHEIGDRLQALPRQKASWPPKEVPKEFLPLTWHALGIWEDDVLGPASASSGSNRDTQADPAPKQDSELKSSELEIARALRTAYEARWFRQTIEQLGRLYDKQCEIGKQARELESVKATMDKLLDLGKTHLPQAEQNQLRSLESKPQEQLSHDEAMLKNRLRHEAILSLPAEQRTEYNTLDAQRLQLEARRQAILLKSVPNVERLASYGIDIAEIHCDPAALDEEIRGKLLAKWRRRMLQQPGLNSASPRVAAADEMLKELIIAIEDDLARLFVEPMIVRLRTRLMGTGVSVGILQRESMLATNRGKARVDPRASAQLSVGEEQDILTGIQQLAQLYSVVQSGGALAALGALQEQPREPQPEIVALTTGNRFDVTPIFDPTGQALRFKFDFVGSSKVQEPNGSTDPQFPRIERHTVNTEVQLSNLETREISRYESDARLGRPARYWGGFPVLKDIPYVRPWVPLVGWFVRKGGSNAVAQQSVIFGQTTIYPTIGALVDLLSDFGPESQLAPATNPAAAPATQPATQPSAAPPPAAPPSTQPQPKAAPPPAPKGANP